MARRVSTFKAQFALVALAGVGALFDVAVAMAVAEPASAQTDRSLGELRVEQPGTGVPGPLPPL